MKGWRISILNKWKFFVPELSISFQNEWKRQPWINQGYGTFTHLWRFIMDDGDHLKKYSKNAPNLGYWKSIHIWFLEFGMHVYIG